MIDPDQRIVLTGVGLTAPNGNELSSYRHHLLEGKSNIQRITTRYMGEVLAGVCDYDTSRYQKRRDLRTGTRAGSVGIYCAHEAVKASGIDWEQINKARVGVYIGTTEHGNVETENEIYNISQYNYDTKYWSHHHNPRTVANNPAGEITINMGITGPHYAIGAACAAGNAGLIQACQMLRLHEVDMAIAGGVSESIHTFGIFAAFKSQGALAEHPDPNRASRPFDRDRNGIVVSEGGALYTVERLSDARKRNAPILGEIAGYAMNSDATNTVLPHTERQIECMHAALAKAGITPADVDIINTHATSTPQGDAQECRAVKSVFGDSSTSYVNNTKSYIGHAMGAAGALELAGNLPAFQDGLIHPTINIDALDPECEIPQLVIDKPINPTKVEFIFNNSFGMLGTNSALLVCRYEG